MIDEMEKEMVDSIDYMDIYSPKGTRVKYIGISDAQVNWGSNDDPREYLELDKIYTVERTEIHSWHTKVCLQEVQGKKFNSSAFGKVKESEENGK